MNLYYLPWQSPSSLTIHRCSEVSLWPQFWCFLRWLGLSRNVPNHVAVALLPPAWRCPVNTSEKVISWYKTSEKCPWLHDYLCVLDPFEILFQCDKTYLNSKRIWQSMKTWVSNAVSTLPSSKVGGGISCKLFVVEITAWWSPACSSFFKTWLITRGNHKKSNLVTIC